MRLAGRCGVAEATAYLCVGTNTLLGLLKSGALPSVRVGSGAHAIAFTDLDIMRLKRLPKPAATEKQCRICKTVKPMSNFYTRRRGTGRSGDCDSCTKQRRTQQRDQAVAAHNARKSAPCMDCGKRFPPECMDFDHVRGSKKFNIAVAVRNMTPSLEAELAKCELVCANCHRIRTKQRINWERVIPAAMRPGLYAFWSTYEASA